jgi:hypothetical protein
MQPDSTPPVRISDAQREQALTRLRHACIDGRLTLEEFSERTEAVLTARTEAQLIPAIADVVTIRSSSSPAVSPPVERIVAVLGDVRRRGRWRIHPQTVAIAVAGDCELDLRGVEVTADEVEITVYAVMGDVTLIVPEGIDVDLTGVAVMGDRRAELADVPPLPGAPRIRVRAHTFIGDVKVKNEP